MRITLALLAFCLIVPGSVFAQKVQSTTPEDYNFLIGMGQWVEAKRFGGQVWKPNVAADWRPYRYGEWIPTNKGWLWHSYEPFGWALYHYGNWYYDLGVGWYWVPGYEWSPARVLWKSSENYSGWAPAPPKGFEIDAPGKTPGETVWSVVQKKDFVRPDIGELTIREIPEEFNKSATSKPPDVPGIEKATGQKLTQITLKKMKRGQWEDVELPPEIRDRVLPKVNKFQNMYRKPASPQTQQKP